MIATPSPIPPPRPDDDEDVHWALSTASALWARGDASEAIKWLRRAAETASDQNRDQRSLELFKAAADATSLVRPAGPTAPLPAPPPPNPAPPAPARQVGPTGTISMQIPPGHAPPLGPPPGQGGQGGGQSPLLPMARPSAPAPAPHASSPPSRAPVPQRVSVPAAPPPGAAPGAGGPPAGTARAAAAQANAQTQASRSGFAPQRPMGSAGVGNTRQTLKATLPSEGAGAPGDPAASRAVPAARPTPGAGSTAPSSAAKRADAKKQPLDARFQFPDEEVTVQRDLAALKRPRPVHTELAEDAAASAATQRAPVPTAPTAARTLISTTAGSAAAAGASGPTVRGLQPNARATAAEIAPPARHVIVNEPTAADPDPDPDQEREHEHTPLDDLDEQTSVLAGDEAELEFEGSATGETSAAMLASIEQNAIQRSQLEEDGTGEGANLDEGVTGEESSDPRHGGLSVPSVRPEPMPRPAALPGAAAQRDASAWTAVRVAVRRDASGAVRVEALARGARPSAGAIAAVLVAQDDASADALAKLLDG